MENTWVETLIDAEGMIRNEIKRLKTGHSCTAPMRDCLGQWESLLRDIQGHLNKD